MSTTIATDEHRVGQIRIRVSPPMLLLGLLALRLMLALPIVGYAGWFAHEADFYSVARSLVTTGHPPSAEDFPDRPGVPLQADQPPLYNVVIVPLVALLDNDDPVPPSAPPMPICYGWDETRPAPIPLSDLSAYTPGWQNPASVRVLIRLVNLLLASLAVTAMYAAGRRLLPESARGGLFAAALLACEPNTLFATTIIGNDALLLLIAAVYLLLIVRVTAHDETSAWEWGGIVLCTLLAALTRLNGWVLLPVTLIVMALVFRSRRWTRLTPQTHRRIWIGIGALALGFAVLLPINLITTGSLFGRYRELEEVLLAGLPFLARGNNGLTVFSAILHDTGVNSYLSAFDFLERQRLSALIGWATLLLLISGLIAGAALLWRGRRATLIALFSLAAFTLALVFARHAAALPVTTADSTTYIFAPLRYYLPALPALALLIGLALGRYRWIALLGVVMMVIWIAALIATPQYQTRVAESPVITPDQLAALSLTAPTQPAVGDYPRLVGSAWERTAVTNQLRVQLATTLERPTLRDYQARIEFFTPDGHSTFCQFPPTEGSFSTSHWTAGALIYTDVSVPICPSALPAGTRIDLRWQDASGAASPPILLGVLANELPSSANCPPILGTIDASLIIREYTAPRIQRVGALYLPAVHWYTLARTRAVSRTYRITHETTGVEYVCQGEPRQNTYPFAAWTPGTTTYFDECLLTLPADAPLGVYQVTLAAFDAAGAALPAVDANGVPLADSWLPVAVITLVKE